MKTKSCNECKQLDDANYDLLQSIKCWNTLDVGPCLLSRFGNHAVFAIGEICYELDCNTSFERNKVRTTEANSTMSRVATRHLAIRGVNKTFSALKNHDRRKKNGGKKK